MCFSAPASFTASAGLLLIGALTVREAKTTPQYVLSSLPLIFSVQQFSEGLLWLSLLDVGYSQWQYPAMYMFLFVAQVVWPSYIPLAILLFEKDTTRKKILSWMTGVGVFTSLYFVWCLLFYSASAQIEQQHIKYDLAFPFANQWYSGITYILAAVIGPFVSSLKPLRILGMVLLISYLATRMFYMHYLVSVWCFFAAVLSLMVYVMVRRFRDLARSPKVPEETAAVVPISVNNVT